METSKKTKDRVSDDDLACWEAWLMGSTSVTIGRDPANQIACALRELRARRLAEAQPEKLDAAALQLENSKLREALGLIWRQAGQVVDERVG